METVNVNERAGHQFPQTWVVVVFLVGIGGLSVLATVTSGAYDDHPSRPLARIVAASSPASPATGADNSRECDPAHGVDSDCIVP